MDKYNNFLFENLIVRTFFLIGFHLKYCINKDVKKKIKNKEML